MLERGGQVQQKGVPDGPTMGTMNLPTTGRAEPSSYFIFCRHGDSLTVFPVDEVVNFKPLPRCAAQVLLPALRPGRASVLLPRGPAAPAPRAPWWGVSNCQGACM